MNPIELKFYSRGGMFLSRLFLSSDEELRTFLEQFRSGLYDITYKFVICKSGKTTAILVAKDFFKGTTSLEEFVLRGLT